jgi:hypothetical protein
LFLAARHLNSHDAKCVAVKKAYRKLKPHRRPPVTELSSIAASLDPWKGSDEAVIVHYKPKSEPGTYRVTMDFGIEHRSLQYLVASVLAELVDIHPQQYTVEQGLHAAVKSVATALKAGPMYAVELDIKDCYPSFEEAGLTDLLPLPKEVSRNVLISKYLYLQGGNVHEWFGPAAGEEWEETPLLDAALADARRGIPQGSAASSILAEALLAPVLHEVPPVGTLAAYGDNVIVLAHDENDVVFMTSALWTGLKTHPAGRLRPTAKAYTPGKPIDFLGHRFIVEAPGIVAVVPTPSNVTKFEHRVNEELKLIGQQTSPILRWRRIRKLKRYVHSWSTAFKLCDGIQSLRSSWLAKIPDK